MKTINNALLTKRVFGIIVHWIIFAQVKGWMVKLFNASVW